MTVVALDNDFTNIVAALTEINEDQTIPKNIKSKIQGIIGTLSNDLDVSIRANKALDELEEVVNDSNIEPYTRTQFWNIISLLEKADSSRKS